MADEKIKGQLVQYITENFVMTGEVDLDKVDSFMETGILDSTGILELIGFIEETFDFEVDDDEMVPENLDSVANAVGFIQKKLAN